MTYYLNSKKFSKQPYKKEQIIKMLMRGHIQPHQECFVESIKNKCSLKPLYKIDEFRTFFPHTLKNEAHWTLLKKYKGKFVQSGPYSQKGLQFFLQQGWISDQDFVWKDGWDSWVRISVCMDLHTRMDATVEDLLDQLSDAYNPATVSSHVTYYQRPRYPDWSKWKR